MENDRKIDFIGIGSAKSGSSWISVILADHPDINLSYDKSLFFFNSDHGNEYVKDNWTNWDKGIDWYISRFPKPEKGKIRGEFGVSYLHDSLAPQRIKEYFPDTKILVTLRNPVDMLYSLYWYNVNTVEANVPKTFEEAVEKKWCLDRGNYSKHLEKFYALFPKENIHVVIFDDIKNDPKSVSKNLYSFLGVDENYSDGCLTEKVYPAIGSRFPLLKKLCFNIFRILNVFKLKKIKLFILNTPFFYSIYSKINIIHAKYPPMDPEIRLKLHDYYAKDIHELEKIISRDLSMWLK